MSDVTMSAVEAKRWATYLRTIDDSYYAGARELADRLDPPAPSLRDEVAEAIAVYYGTDPGSVARDVLAVVRRHVEADSIPGSIHGREVMYRDDVLRLLGGPE